MRIALTGEFTTLDVSEGTLQNVSRQVPIEIATTTTKDTGIILQPGESIQFQSDAAVYARSVEMNPEARETPYLAHVPFKGKGEGGDESNNSRKASKAYEVGDIAYLSSLSLGKKLVCVAAGTTASGGLAPASTDEGAIVTDGTVKWAIDSMADRIYNAAHHNSYYRGADITAYFESGDMSTNIANNVFANIYPGDYIRIPTLTIPAIEYTPTGGSLVHLKDEQVFTNQDFIVGDLNYFGGNTPHVFMVSKNCLGTARMNPTNAIDLSLDGSTKAYRGCEFFNYVIPAYDTAIKSAFGDSHVLSHTEALTHNVSLNDKGSGSPSSVGVSIGMIDTTVYTNILNEIQVTGCSLVSSSYYDGGNCVHQLAVFCHNKLAQLPSGADTYWYRVVHYYAGFGRITTNGRASYERASTQQGVRIGFLLK